MSYVNICYLRMHIDYTFIDVSIIGQTNHKYVNIKNKQT